MLIFCVLYFPPCVGVRALARLHQSLPFKQIRHVVTVQDHQPTTDSCIISMVVGQLKVSDPFGSVPF